MARARKRHVAKDPIIKMVQEHFTDSHEHLKQANKMIVDKKKRLDIKKFIKAMESSPELW